MLIKPMNYQQQQTPGPVAQVVYIAGDTLRHQPMGAGHMDGAPVYVGPMACRALQWGRPMLGLAQPGQAVVPG